MVFVLAVADTDSYLKWSVATLAQLDGAKGTQVVLDNPVAPSPAQRAAAGAADAPVVTRTELTRLVRRHRPDVVLLACTGPVVATLLEQSWARRPRRPVLMTGLPGISIPPTRRALRLRAGCDLFVLHSRREVTEFAVLAGELGQKITFGLARLPFLGPTEPSASDIGDDVRRAGGDVVFAAQAKVPAQRQEREAVLLALAASGGAVVKLRAATGEQQTHHERYAYPDLFDELVADGRAAAGSVRFASGSMTRALTQARALVTVSSTAALEAMAAGVPVLLVDDFGVSDAMINTVFAGSGCLGSLREVAAGGFRHPEPAWLADNYFHRADEDNVDAALERLLQLRRAGLLPRPVLSRTSLPRRWRRRLRLTRLGRALASSRPGRGRRARAPHPTHLGS